jgi:hypothetical protein
MKGKKGSHVGVIASFSIFMLFLVALYLIVEPTIKTQKDKRLILDYLNLRIKEEFSANFTTIVIANSSSSNRVCASFNKNEVGVNGQNAYAKDKNNDYIEIDNSNPNTLLVKWVGNESFIKIFFSEESFNSLPPTICANTSNNYQIESTTKEKQLFEAKIVYGMSDFVSLKNTINISKENDWGMGFVYNNGTTISSGAIDTLREIYAQEMPITYIDRNANLVSGKLVVSIW